MSSIAKYSVIAGVAAAVILLVAGYVGYNNAEVRLRNQISVAQTDLENQLDKTVKTISGAAQVSQFQMESLKEIIVGNAEARKLGPGGGLMQVIHEAVPNLDTTSASFTNLQNLIVGARESYATKQTLILDLKREHDNLRTVLPSSLFVGSRPEIKVQIVTSTRAKQSMSTGVDDDDTVFKKK